MKLHNTPDFLCPRCKERKPRKGARMFNKLTKRKCCGDCYKIISVNRTDYEKIKICDLEPGIYKQVELLDIVKEFQNKNDIDYDNARIS